jgi:DNA-binding Lrp family transcriptional regulator
VRRLSDLDRSILLALREDGRLGHIDLSRRTGAPISTIHRRMSVLFDEGHVRVAVMPEVDADELRLYEVRFRCRPGKQREVARALTTRRDTLWVAVVTGDFGVVAEVVIPTGGSVASVVLDDLEQTDDNVVSTQSSLLLRRFKEPDSVRGHFPCDPDYLLPDATPAWHADELDRAIVTALLADGRKSYAAVASDVGANESTVRRRLTSMLQERRASVVSIVDPVALGYEQAGMIRLDVVPEHLAAVAAQLVEHPDVQFLAATFGETALSGEIYMRSPESVYEFVTETIGRAPGIVRMLLESELVVTKRAFLPTPWSTWDTPLPPKPLDPSAAVTRGR